MRKHNSQAVPCYWPLKLGKDLIEELCRVDMGFETSTDDGIPLAYLGSGPGAQAWNTILVKYANGWGPVLTRLDCSTVKRGRFTNRTRIKYTLGFLSIHCSAFADRYSYEAYSVGLW